MTEVIYADVLVVLNIYVTYTLLSLTGIICRKKRNSLKLLISSSVAGIYSLIILIPDLNEVPAALTRIPMSLLLCLIAFGFSSKKTYLKLWLTFLAVSFSFAGIMLFLWFFFSPQGMYYNNGIVYFNIDTATLVILTVICYVFLSLCQRYIKTKIPSATVYDCEIFLQDYSVCCHCFLDTGNSLTDPYTGFPVVIITKERAEKILPDISFDEFKSGEPLFRLIPCRGISGGKLLKGFRCDKIRVKGLETDFLCKDVIIAVTDERIHGGSFDGILPPQIFEDHTHKKGADFDNEIQSNTVKT